MKKKKLSKTFFPEWFAPTTTTVQTATISADLATISSATTSVDLKEKKFVWKDSKKIHQTRTMNIAQKVD
jgi:hypothetical protein